MQETILKKLLDIQSQLKAKKGQYNSFGKYKYRKAEDILEAVKPLLKMYNCIVTTSDTLEEKSGKQYIKATAALYCTETGETISADGWAREPETRKGMDESQVTGATSSYARKYALNGLFAIDDGNDADTENYRRSIAINALANASSRAEFEKAMAENLEFVKSDKTTNKVAELMAQVFPKPQKKQPTAGEEPEAETAAETPIPNDNDLIKSLMKEDTINTNIYAKI